MSQSFRPYPEPGTNDKGSFSLLTFLHNSIANGPFHFLPLVSHIIIPIYGVYRLLKQSGYWNAQVDYAVDGLLVPLLQGLSVGGILGTFILRYCTPEGRRVASKRADYAATDDEEANQHRLEIVLWSFIYLGFATVLWQRFPVADGPGMTAFKRLAGKVGVDLGDAWRTRKD